MKNYILLSNKFEGYVVYGFNVAGYLVHFENCTLNMTIKQTEYTLQSLGQCLVIDEFGKWVKNNGFKIVKVEEDLSFERFWLEYDNPRDKFKCEPLWKWLPDAHKQYVFHNIKAYKRYMKKNKDWYNQLLPETYLKNSWRSEWDKITEKK